MKQYNSISIILLSLLCISVISCKKKDYVFEYKQTHSYSALSNIVDEYIDSESNGPLHKDMVKELLGPNEAYGTLNGSYSEDIWVYSSDRDVNFGSYLLIHFKKDCTVESVEWASE